MASVLVKNLPSASSINGTDLVIVNIGEGEEYVTSNMSIAEFKTALNSNGTGSNDLNGDVNVDGNVTITKVGSKFFGDLKGTAETVSTLSPFTTADLPSDGINLYFTASDATKLADLRTDLTALSVRVDNVALTLISVDEKVDENSASLTLETAQRVEADELLHGRLSYLESIDKVTEAEIKAFAQEVTDETLDATLPDYSTTAQADLRYQPISTASNTVDGNATDIAANATAISNEESRATTKESQLEADIATNVSNIATKAPIASPTFTGTVGGITPAMVGLGAVDNTSDASKPVSTAQQTAINGKVTKSSISFSKIAGVDGSNAAAVDALNAAVEALIAAMNA